eukprot:403332180
MQKALTSFFSKRPSAVGTTPSTNDLEDSNAKGAMGQPREFNQKKSRTISEITPCKKEEKKGGNSNSKTSSNTETQNKIAHPPRFGEKVNQPKLSNLENDEEETPLRRKQTQRRTYKDESDEEYEVASKLNDSDDIDIDDLDLDESESEVSHEAKGNKRKSAPGGNGKRKPVQKILENKKLNSTPAPPKKQLTSSATGQNSTAASATDKKVMRQSDISNSSRTLNDEPSYIDQEDQVIGGGFQTHDDILEARPDFIKEEYIMDMEKRKPEDPEYDPTTLYIPGDKWNGFTPAMYQYWEIKVHNYDKILFFKLGKFYEIFYNDAIICQKLLDLNWMGGAKKLHIGFPEKVLDKYLVIMVNHGYKVAVIEQTETPQMMERRLKEERLAKKKMEPKDKCVKREIFSMVTKGTFKDNNQSVAGYEPKFVLSVKRYGSELGVTFFDVQTLKIYVGQFTDDEALSNFRTLLCQIRPIEVIHEREIINSDMLKMLKNSPVVPVFTPMVPKNCWGVIKTCNALETYIGPSKNWPELLQKFKEQDAELALQSLGMAIAFLEEALIAQQTISTGEFHLYTPETQSQLEYMVLDSQALQHLEVVESASGKFEGSLLHYIDHCKSPFGRRQLKRWVLSPLMNIQRIEERLDAIEDLIQHQYETDVFRSKLSKLPDIEKLLAKIYTYSIKNRVKAIYFENVSLIKLKEFRILLKHFRVMEELCESLMNKKNEFKSQRLRQLLTPDTEQYGLFPTGIKDIVKEFEGMIVWKKTQGGGPDDEIPEPQMGLDEEFDRANEAVDKVKQKLESYLQQIRSQFKDRRINWSHAKYRYELELPAELIDGKKKPADFEFTSQRNGYQRFHTKEIKQYVEELEVVEEKLKDDLTPFLCALFQKFHEHKDLWNRTMNVITELDCLCSLSIVSGQSVGDMCRPQFVGYQGEYANSSLLDIKQLRHPCVTLNQTKSFVPNNTLLAPNQDQTLLLVTGPNMGGKSTLLRQTCIAVILAQIGCYVPAQSIKLNPVDRIFTRIGASDRILEGKSTFYVEMEETKNIIQFATFKSLAIVDELGRGTSTFDGYSIAHAVLKYLVNNIRCRSLFATHYHMLLDEFRGARGVKSYHMACRANEDKDEVMFLYRFEKGECPTSFGINVARMAGIPKNVLDAAKRKSLEFSEKLNILTDKVKEHKHLRSNNMNEQENSQS